MRLRIRPDPEPPPPMPDDTAPLRVLLIDDGAHRVALIRDELVRRGHEVVGVVDDAESPSRDTLEHLATLSGRHPKPVVVFAEDEAADPLRQAMAAGVSAYVVAGLQPERLAAVLRVAIARFEQERALREQLAQARQALSQRKVVDRAKGLLMKRHAIGEDEAYALLRKAAMDKGLKIVEVAQRLLDVADLLA